MIRRLSCNKLVQLANFETIYKVIYVNSRWRIDQADVGDVAVADGEQRHQRDEDFVVVD